MPIPGGFASAPTVTVAAVDAPTPGVRITITGPAAGAVKLTIYRSSASAGKVIVRGASHATFVSSFSVVDFEAPLGEVLTYTAVTFDIAEVQSDESAGAAITIGSAYAWLSDPLSPQGATQVRLKDPPDLVMELDRALLLPIGADAPYQVSGVRQRGSYTLVLTAADATARNAIRALVRSAPVLLLRVPDATGWDFPAAFLGLGTITERRIGKIQQAARYIEMDATIVARPAPELAGPLHTYDEMKATGRTYDQIKATGRTYTQLVQQGAV